jgi:hypothetical protein
VEIDTNVVVLDVTTAWTIEATAFLVAGLGFLAWSMAVRNRWGSLVAFAIEIVVALAVELLFRTLYRAERLKGASPLPAGARQGSPLRYAVVCIVTVGVPFAVTAALAVALSAPNLAGGWFAAFGIVRVVSVLRVREMERRDRVEYHLPTGRSRPRGYVYYFTSSAF